MPEAAADTSLKIAQRACILAHMTPISSFTQAVPEANVLNNLYEDTVEYLLGRYPWRFAMKAKSEAQLGSGLQTHPEGDWYLYNKPNDAIAIRSVSVNGYPRKFDVYGNQLLVDAAEGEAVVIDYTYRAGETQWPGYFILPFTYYLAAQLGFSIAENAELFETLDSKADMHLRKAQRMDAQGRTAQQIPLNRFKSVRLGAR